MSHLYKLFVLVIIACLIIPQIMPAASPAWKKLNDISTEGFYTFNKGETENYYIIPSYQSATLTHGQENILRPDQLVIDNGQLFITIDPTSDTEINRGDSLVFTITVVDEQNQPVSNADVFVTDSLNNINSNTGKTDISGRTSYIFRVSGSASNGLYYIDFEASAQGYINSAAERRFVHVLSGTGANDRTEKDIKAGISPNPAGSICYVTVYLDQSEDVIMELYDLTGKSFMSSSRYMQPGETMTPLSLESMPKGYYLMKVTIGDKVFNLSFVVCR